MMKCQKIIFLNNNCYKLFKTRPQQIKTKGETVWWESALSSNEMWVCSTNWPIGRNAVPTIGCVHWGIFRLCGGWVTGRGNRYSSEKPTHYSSAPARVSFFFFISSSLSLRYPHTLLPLSFSDGIEMLHLRSTAALKDLFHTQLKRPLGGRLKAAATPAASACFSTGASNAGWYPAGRVTFCGWSAPPRTDDRRAGVRAFCSKGDGHSDAAKESEKWVALSVWGGYACSSASS